ncbi:MAG: flavin monoamine oxidase family protein, partial [Oceanobacter sp.]
AHYKLGQGIEEHELPDGKKFSVVIVGAGMSGLYSAWRLQEEKGITDVAIFEQLNRTGGRLDSDLVEFNNLDKSPGQPDTITVKEEQGGMRFLFNDMDDLMALFLMLDLQDQIVPFPMNSGGNNRLYYRGKSFTVAESKENDYAIWSELYNLKPEEQGVNPKDIVNTVFNRILQANPQFTDRPNDRSPTFWQDFRLDCKWEGKGLNEWSLWDLFTAMGYSQECITMLYRVLGFNGTFLSKMNAGVAYQLLEDFPADVQFRTFKDGFSTLPNALVDRIKAKICLERTIQKIDYDSKNEEYILTYSKVGSAVTKEVRADKVILGLPRLALEKLFFKSDALNKLDKEKSQKLWYNLQSASNQPLLKINLYYDKAWWGNGISGRPPVEFGPNFADLPTGSVYPFYAVDNKLAASLMYNELEHGHKPDDELAKTLSDISESKYSKPAALTIYCDYLNINFWSALQNVSEPYHHPDQATFIKDAPGDMTPASKAVVEQATKFFQDIFNTHFVPAPVLTSARIWEGSVQPGAHPGYGVHQWAVGFDDRKVMEELVEPLDNLFTCGEAFSDYQGWVEGALRSTDLVLKKAFDLEPLSEKYKADYDIEPSKAITKAYQENATALIQEYLDPDFKHETTDEIPFPFKNELGVTLNFFDKK